MKAYTNISQSKKLAEILPIKSADMWWNFYSVTTDNTTPQIIHLNTPWVGNFNWDNKSDNVPCWSLAALFSVLPSDIIRNEKTMFLTLEKAGAYNLYYKSPDRLDELWETDFEPIDACYKMIMELNELKLL